MSRSESSEGELDFDYSSGSSDEGPIAVFLGEGSEADEVEREQLGVQFGLYEPVLAEEDREIDEDDDDNMGIDEDRLNNKDWCNCGHCEVHQSFKLGDCICCREIPEVVAETDRYGSACITTTEPFKPAILHPVSLYIGWLDYTDKWKQAAKSFEARNNEKYRYVAYRKLVRWCWGWLGKDIRVQTPACAHYRIMKEYPDADGQYTGTELHKLKVD